MTTRSFIASLALVCSAVLVAAPAPAGAAPHGAASSDTPAATGAAPRAATRIDFPGRGVEVRRGSGDERRLRGTTADFRRFVRARLDRLFREAGSRPRCATSPTVVVQRFQGSGDSAWATAGEGWYSPCPAGGYAVLYERTGSGWRAVLGTQEARFCQDLAWYGVPVFVAGRTCLTEDFRQVGYRSHGDVGASPEATARRAVSAAGGHRIVPSRHVSTTAAREQLAALVDHGAYLEVGDCVVAGDDDPLAAQLGDATYGCEVTATHRRRADASYLLRMETVGEDVVATDVVALAQG